MNLIKLKCENCGATLEVDTESDKITCNYCKSEILIDDEATSIRRIEDAKLKARIENYEQDIKEKRDIEEMESKEKFKKSKFSKVLLIFFAIAILFFFAGFGLWIKFLTFTQAGLFISAWLMGMKIIKEPMKGLNIIFAIIAFVLIIPIIRTGGGNTTSSQKYDKINWNYIILKEYLPEPNENKGKILTNSDEHLSIYISAKSEDDYREYIEDCKDFGYIINAKNNTSSYDAYNEKGFKLRIWYSEYSKEYHISLDKKAEENEAANDI